MFRSIDRRDLLDFIHDPREGDTILEIDKDANELVVRCPHCGAEARYRREQLDEIALVHAISCPTFVKVYEA